MGPRMKPTSCLLRLFYFCTATTVILFLFSSDEEQQATKVLRGNRSTADVFSEELVAEIVDHEDYDDLPDTNVPMGVTRRPLFSVRGAHCIMPYVDPFAPETMAVFKPEAPQNCSAGVRPIVESVFDANLRRYVLHMDESVARTLANYSGDFSCCYREIVRKENDDNDYHWLPCTQLHQEFVVPLHIEAITVDCYSANGTRPLQQDAFVFVQLKELDANRTHPSVTNKRKPSVMMIGIDALSRINFKRNMVKTHAYLKRKRWYEMEGYNKMGDNTFPNLMAVMAGFDEDMANERCRPNEDGGLDACPLVWKDFSAAGYRTAYAEDESEMSTFNYCKRGFRQPPTDYYLRPFYKAFEDQFEERKRCGLRDCFGIRPTAGYIYDYALQLGRRYNDEPLFGLFWANSISHNCYDTASALDDLMLGFLRDFEESGVMDTSIVVFFSDHGMRWGTLTELPDGFFEERWPMLHIWLPRWFARQHPQFAEALRINQHRLTSPYDLHQTLKHLVRLASDADADDGRSLQGQAAKCPACQSLFHEMPADRSCEDAGIPEHWCSCIPYEVVANDDRAKQIAAMVAAEIYHYLKARNFGTLCSPLTLDHVKSTHRQMDLEEDRGKRNQSEVLYRIKFVVEQNEAVFQATVVRHEASGGISVDVETISRLNSYEHDSQCVDDKQAKKYCICRDALGATKSE